MWTHHPSSTTSATTLGSKRGRRMVQRVTTVAFEGIEARAVDVQVQVAPGLPAFKMIGSPVVQPFGEAAYRGPGPVTGRPAPGTRPADIVTGRARSRSWDRL